MKKLRIVSMKYFVVTGFSFWACFSYPELGYPFFLISGIFLGGMWAAGYEEGRPSQK